MLARITAVAALILLTPSVYAASATMGDSAYGRVTAVRKADVVVFTNPGAEYVLRIVGIVVPRDERVASEATNMVRTLVLGKDVRFRLERRLPDGELLVRLYTADTNAGIVDVGLQLVRAGLAQKASNFDYKYRELATAEIDARRARRGFWANQR